MVGQCFLSGRWGVVERHHIFGGPYRKASERYGLVVYLSPEKHRTDPDAAHRCRVTAERLKRYGQARAMEEQGWTVEQFRSVFERSYLDEAAPPEPEAVENGFRVTAGALPF